MPEDFEFGFVTTFDLFKGYGFIRRDKGKDVFFFYPDICHDDKILSPGDKVKFKVENRPKGPKAIAIEKIGV